jgi:hypothetical protein
MKKVIRVMWMAYVSGLMILKGISNGDDVP